VSVVSAEPAGAGLTTQDIARRFRVSEEKVRRWIHNGELRAINTATVLSGRPRWVIPPEALTEFEQRRAGGPAPKLQRRRKRPKAGFVDYYADAAAGGKGGRS
jgi:excisionase family DNA binding protein